jgi:hypothetical protein
MMEQNGKTNITKLNDKPSNFLLGIRNEEFEILNHISNSSSEECHCAPILPIEKFKKRANEILHVLLHNVKEEPEEPKEKQRY